MAVCVRCGTDAVQGGRCIRCGTWQPAAAHPDPRARTAPSARPLPPASNTAATRPPSFPQAPPWSGPAGARPPSGPRPGPPPGSGPRPPAAYAREHSPSAGRAWPTTAPHTDPAAPSPQPPPARSWQDPAASHPHPFARGPVPTPPSGLAPAPGWPQPLSFDDTTARSGPGDRALTSPMRLEDALPELELMPDPEPPTPTPLELFPVSPVGPAPDTPPMAGPELLLVEIHEPAPPPMEGFDDGRNVGAPPRRARISPNIDRQPTAPAVGPTRCERCGIPFGATPPAFCDGCGAKVPKWKKKSASADTRRCIDCGFRKNPGDASRCGNCGMPLRG
jgi:hypothetical protein